jgi:hypothetical protein
MDEQKSKKRDGRLLVALLLFVVSMVCGLIQAWILRLYIDAAVYGNWTHFSEIFSVRPPASGPNEYCFDYCAADLPFLAGWIGLVSFLSGVVTVVHSWWKPRSHVSP